MINFWIYGKQDCLYCDKAKALLESKGHGYVFLDVGQHPEWRDPEWKTVPQIFYVSHYIGGYRALEAFLDAE